MPFDLSTAKPVSGGFNLSTAQPVTPSPQSNQVAPPIDLKGAIQDRLMAKNTQTSLPVGPNVGEAPTVGQQTNQPNPTLMDKIKGAGEAALSTVTGLTGGTLGTIGGFLGAEAGRLHEYLIGRGIDPQKAADIVQELSQKQAQNLTFSPKTETGQQYTQNISKVGEYLTPIAGLGGETQLLSESAQGLKTLGKPYIKAVNAVKGKVSNEEYQNLLNAAKEHNIPMTYGDVTQGPIVTKAEQATEIMPVVGTAKYREVQNLSAQQAAEKFKGSLHPTEGDWTRIVQNSLKSKASAVKSKASELYRNVDNVADPAGPIPLDNFRNIAQGIIDKIKAKPEQLRTATDNEILNRTEQYLTTPDVNFSTARQLRSDLGDEVSSFYNGANGVIGKKGANAYQQLKNAVEQDLQGFAENKGGQIYQAWKNADSYYKNNVIPFKDASVAKAMKTAEPDIIYSNFIKRGRGDRAKNFFDLLDENGRNAVRYGMVDDAIQRATANEKPFSPAIFSKTLDDVSGAKNVFFKGGSRKQLDGLINVMRHIKRAGQYMENPPTGQRVIGALMVGALPIAPNAIAAATMTSLAIKALFTTKIGRNYLLAASKINPMSPEMANLINKMEAFVTASAVSSRSSEQSKSNLKSQNTSQ